MRAAAVQETFAALSDPTRRGVVELLRSGPRRVGELTEALEMNKPAMTRHLRLLREAGLVQEESLAEDARVRVYRLRKAPFEELRSWLDEIEAGWSLQLDSFKRHAERTRGRASKREREP
ncbi:MAG: metalloregulator ArsR/SmtB family transcription factor [Myxococcales bacterium]